MSETTISLRDRYFKEFPTVYWAGIKCWKPAVFAKIVGVHRNTVRNWINRTIDRELNFPFMGPPLKGSRKVFIPCDRAMRWLRHGIPE